MIHPTAIVHPQAEVEPTAEVGPYAVIEADVQVGAGCVLGPHVHLLGRCRIGARNRFHTGCVIGDAPQDLKYRGQPTGLRIGEDNVFREHVTVHRSNRAEEETVIGSSCFFMAQSHVGHNSRVGDRVILANGALLGGHVEVHDRAFISGHCLIHQFVRVGTLALMQGGAGISKDLPPYTIARGDNAICGLNVVGLRRAGFTNEQRLELKRLYHTLFRSDRPWRTTLDAARREFASAPAVVLLDFLGASTRGVCADAAERQGPAIQAVDTDTEAGY
ncbi:MAG: acyl-ACP--UDP-N-acetylglucosamine O-acyltransferase [Verrucomicrobia bacterium]|nr:acyl-ACP--UDP-N-acetylglucosamine O-acyltransferase [Verrucomicrobiota bacterium]